MTDLIRTDILPAGLLGAMVGLSATVLTDSFFWSPHHAFPIWPELHGFLYNTVQGHASEWGTSPFHTYFLSSLPKLMLNPMTYLVCMPLALSIQPLQSTSSKITMPIFAFVAVYSLLPHKEWRFVVYVIPSLTAVSAAGAAWIWTRRGKNLLYRLLSLSLVASVAMSMLASTALLYISSLNYPGGAALQRLHEIVDTMGLGTTLESHINAKPGPNVDVYLDNMSCQTGVTRFLQKPITTTKVSTTQKVDLQAVEEIVWRYDKTENQTMLLMPEFWDRFDYVLAEAKERVIGSWTIIDTVYGYAGIGLWPEPDSTVVPPGLSGRVAMIYAGIADVVRGKVTRGMWPVIKMEPKIYILRRGSSS